MLLSGAQASERRALYTLIVPRQFFDPHHERPDGINYLRFYLGTFVAYIKVDQRPSPKPFSQFLLAPGQPLKIIGRDSWKSQEFSIMRDILTKSTRRRRW